MFMVIFINSQQRKNTDVNIDGNVDGDGNMNVHVHVHIDVRCISNNVLQYIVNEKEKKDGGKQELVELARA